MKIYSYIKISTKEYPRFQGDIRLEHPEIGEQFICPNTYIEVYETQQPVVSHGKYIVETYPKQIDEKWVQNFELVDVPQITNENIINYDTPIPIRPEARAQIFPTEATGRIEINILNKESI